MKGIKKLILFFLEKLKVCKTIIENEYTFKLKY